MLKGQKAWNKGIPPSKEVRIKLSIAQKGKKHSKETIEKISQANKGARNAFYGKKHSEETKKRISNSKIGVSVWNKGISMSQVTKEKIRKAKIGKKMPPRSDEHKKKLSIAHKGKPKPWARGEKNPAWNSGSTSLAKRIRHSFKYRQWRSDIYTRDDYTCQLCGVRGGKLQADHFIKSFSDIFNENKITSLEQALECEEFWNLNNGRTLCLSCHGKTDNYGCKSHKKSYANTSV